MDGPELSLALAFAAGVVSFLSPCVLPVAPGWVTFVSGISLDELKEGDARSARRTAIVHTLLFALGFGIVFMTLGAAATAAGQAFNRALPWMQRIGGLLITGFGLHFLGWIRIPFLDLERRGSLARHPGGWFGSVMVGVIFGAGWTPCIGPVLATILFWAGFEEHVWRGMALLTAYGVGLALPFVVLAGASGWVLAGMERVRRWIPLLHRAAGILLVAMGVLLMTGTFTRLSARLADMGQWFTLDGWMP